MLRRTFTLSAPLSTTTSTTGFLSTSRLNLFHHNHSNSNNNSDQDAPPPPKIAKHPSGPDLVFDPKWHTYKFNGKRLISVSKVLDKFFPFDADGVAAKVAQREMKTVEQVKAEWRTSTILGSNVHAHIESLLLNEPRREVRDIHGEEQVYYPAATIAANSIAAQYECIGCEVMVCSPKLRIAGTIDFVGRNRETGAIAIMDWKTTASTMTGFRFGTFDEPCPPPLSHLPNTKMTRYALQVLIYGHLLKTEGYSKFLGKELDTIPMEFGIVQIGKNENLSAIAEFHRILPESVVPVDAGGEVSPTGLLMQAIRS